ncbi:MAG: tagaturonate epimerase family protein [Anaerolineales bacterium]|nr:tagaturonate epimerase family protein [Anaerolineales bacterium]
MNTSFNLASSNLNTYRQSLTAQDGVEYGLVQSEAGPRLAVLADPDSLTKAGFRGESSSYNYQTLVLCPLSAYNATRLRTQLPWLQPVPLGLDTSAGLGDRLGLATPGHIRAVRAVGGKISPIFAQQSMREMARTGRNPQLVMDNATWGIFQEGWQAGVGADADHLKIPADIDICLAAGFTFFTIDPGGHVDNRAETATPGQLRELAEQLPSEIRPGASGLHGKTFQIEHLTIIFDEITLLRAAVKYGKAIVHVAAMYQHLVQSAGDQPFELEVSVDETDQPTSHAEHIYFASQLKRLGVEWVSLAPRYIGRFEKGVDYIGDIAALEDDLAGHAAIARHFGPYKLSLHSGSDKFSVYPPAMRQTRGLVHLKTAGTSYLEALRTIAAVDIDLFKEIYNFARDHYEVDKVTYHVSGEVARAPHPDSVTDWAGLLEQFDAREILHITFGSVLTEKTRSGERRFYDRFFAVLNSNPEAYWQNLQTHFERHLIPFTGAEQI